MGYLETYKVLLQQTYCVTASYHQQNFAPFWKIRPTPTWHPNMILAKYFSTEIVVRRWEKQPRERTPNDREYWQWNKQKQVKTTVFARRNTGFCSAELRNILKAWGLYSCPGVEPSSSAGAVPSHYPQRLPTWTLLSSFVCFSCI